MSKSGAVNAVTDMLSGLGVEFALYNKVVPNPTDKGVSNADIRYHQLPKTLGNFEPVMNFLSILQL